jgi:hypothetical protein
MGFRSSTMREKDLTPEGEDKMPERNSPEDEKTIRFSTKV